MTAKELYEHEMRWFPPPTHRGRLLDSWEYNGTKEHLPALVVIVYEVISYRVIREGRRGRRTAKHLEVRVATATSTMGGQSSFIIEQRDLA